MIAGRDVVNFLMDRGPASASMTNVIKAGATYFAIVYAIGFLLGTVRVFLLAPRVGEAGAVMLEAPLILGASWIASRWSGDRFAVPSAAAPRLAMGSVALGLLLMAETGVSMLLFGRSWTDLLDLYRSVPGLLGLAAQVLFGLLPFFQGIVDNRGRQNRTDAFAGQSSDSNQ
jgi:hypothetical protein